MYLSFALRKDKFILMYWSIQPYDWIQLKKLRYDAQGIIPKFCLLLDFFIAYENVKKNHHTFEWWEFCIYIVIYRLYTNCIT